MLQSQSATIKFEDLPAYSWYEFEGTRSKKFKVRNHVGTVSPGTIYGLKPIRGKRYYLIFPDSYHIAYTLSQREHDQLVEKSKKKRRMPPIADTRAGRKRAIRVNTSKKELDKSNARFKPPHSVPNENKHGINFENYQWRTLKEPSFKYSKTRTKGFDIPRGTKFGVRFYKQVRGGFVVFEDGERWNIPTPVYDDLVMSSDLLPLNRWIKGKLSPEEIKSLQERKVENQKNRDKEEREQERERIRLAKLEEKRRIREKKIAQREKEKEQAQKALNRIPSAPKVLDPVKIKTREEFLSEQMKEQDDSVIELDKMALDEDEDFDVDFEEIEAEDEDFEDPEDEEIDEEEVELEDADQKALEGMLDNELDKVREEARRVQIFDDVDEDEDELDLDDLDEEDEFDIEEDPDLDEDEDEDLSIEEQNRQAEEDEALDADYDDEVDEYDEDDPDGSEEQEEEETDQAEDGQEENESQSDSESESQEEDSEETQEEDEEYQKRKPEEGDVVVFNADETEQREFLLLDIYPLAKNDQITVYKVYDIGEDSGEYRTVRIKQGSKASLEKLAKFVRKLNPKEFAKYYNNMETYEKNPEPITS